MSEIPQHYPIPDDINPPDGQCMTIVIPDGELFRQMLVGQLIELTRWWVYERDENKRGRFVANRWRPNIMAAIDSIGDCPMQIISVECQHVPYDDERCAEWDPDTGVLTLYIPAGAPGPEGPPGTDGTPGLVVNVNIWHVEAQPTDDKRTQAFSGAMSVVVFLSEKIIDFYSAINATTSSIRAAADLVDSIPVLNILPLDEIAGVADEIAEYELAEFTANDSPELREELACKLFCMVVAAEYTCSQQTLVDWAAQLRVDYFPGTAAWQYGIMAGAWPKDDLLRRWWLGTNDGNADWETLCDDCQDVLISRFSGAGADGVVVETGFYDAVNDWINSSTAVPTTFVRFTFTFPEPFLVESVRMHTDVPPPGTCGGGPVRTKTLRLMRSGDVVYEAAWIDNQDCVWKEIADIGKQADALYIDWQRSSSGPIIRFDGLTVEGFALP